MILFPCFIFFSLWLAWLFCCFFVICGCLFVLFVFFDALVKKTNFSAEDWIWEKLYSDRNHPAVLVWSWFIYCYCTTVQLVYIFFHFIHSLTFGKRTMSGIIINLIGRLLVNNSVRGSLIHFRTLYSCWSCGKDSVNLVSNLFCPNCRSLQKPDKSNNYFNIIGVKESFDLDPNELSKKYKNLQKFLHPDKFASR